MLDWVYHRGLPEVGGWVGAGVDGVGHGGGQKGITIIIVIGYEL